MGPSEVSLLDLKPDTQFVEWYVIWYPRRPHYFWARFLKPTHRHVECMRPSFYGPNLTDCMWLVLRPNFEVLHSHIEFDPTPPWEKHPGCTVMKVQVVIKNWKVRQWFHFGPMSCTEIVKFALGINSFWIRTPYQLYKFLKRRHGVLGVI